MINQPPESRIASQSKAWSLWPLGSRAAWLLALLVAMGFWVLSLSAARKNGVSYDEPAYIAAGYTHWQFNDHRMTVLNGPLPHLVQGLPVWLMKPNFVPLDSPIWQQSSLYLAGRELLFTQGNNGEALLMAARAANALFGVGLILVVFVWAKQLWGNTAGILAAILAALSPTLLAQNGVATSDTALTFFFYLGAYNFWRCLRDCTVWTVLGFIVAVTGALTSKLTGPLLPLVCLGILGVELIAHRRSTFQFRWKITMLRTRWNRAFLGAGLLVVSLFAAWGAVWAMHGFRYSIFAPGMESGAQLSRSWDEVMPKGAVLGGTVGFIKDQHLLPEGYLWGLCGIYAEAHKRSAWLHGEYRDTGWLSYFPIAYGIKSTATELLLTGIFLGLLGYAAREALKKRPPSPLDTPLLLTALMPLVLIALIYWTLSIANKVNIGQRHLLPVYPLLYISGGWLLSVNGRWKPLLASLATLLLLGQGIEAARSMPHYLSYFNQSIGGSSNGWKWLVDSSLDWGQDLPFLKKWVLNNPPQPDEARYVAYFGMDDLRVVDALKVQPLMAIPRQYITDAELQLRPGTYIISATMLCCVYVDNFPGTWLPEYGARFAKLQHSLDKALLGNLSTSGKYQIDRKFWSLYERGRFAKLCEYLRRRGPDFEISPALLVFRLSADEINTALQP